MMDRRRLMTGDSKEPITFISEYHDKCFWSFTALATAVKLPVRNYGDQIKPWEVMNEFDRYKIWAGNVGAMHRGRRYQISLDYRLSEANFYKQQVCQRFTGASTNHSTLISECRVIESR